MNVQESLLDGLSRQAANQIKSDTVQAGAELRKALAATHGDLSKAFQVTRKLNILLSGLGDTGQDLSGHGPVVGEADAALNGEVFHVDALGRTTSPKIGQSIIDHASHNKPFVIAGAGAPFADVLVSARAWHASMATDGMFVHYVGLDPAHWDPSVAVPYLEKNILCTAALLVCSACANEAGQNANIIGHGFGCWILNRALRILPNDLTYYANVMQMDPIGPQGALDEMIAAKAEETAAICHVQSATARATLSDTYQLSEDYLNKLPVDVRIA
ncbi:hypothetical protein [Sedimentitalea arenosa]|uniref:Uncharacterized protein n=1 Tax=Sedimentitalea arenosa TaxID=2798803 RepID=A0A8J7J8C4_9RHOB|nr:hypothetical protein [Arenibacterium arenosum]MBJ6370649.1 hypothetical protein [Arenibacterium arenosum]